MREQVTVGGQVYTTQDGGKTWVGPSGRDQIRNAEALKNINAAYAEQKADAATADPGVTANAEQPGVDANASKTGAAVDAAVAQGAQGLATGAATMLKNNELAKVEDPSFQHRLKVADKQEEASAKVAGQAQTEMQMGMRNPNAEAGERAATDAALKSKAEVNNQANRGGGASALVRTSGNQDVGAIKTENAALRKTGQELTQDAENMRINAEKTRAPDGNRAAQDIAAREQEVDEIAKGGTDPGGGGDVPVIPETEPVTPDGGAKEPGTGTGDGGDEKEPSAKEPVVENEDQKKEEQAANARVKQAIKGVPLDREAEFMASGIAAFKAGDDAWNEWKKTAEAAGASKIGDRTESRAGEHVGEWSADGAVVPKAMPGTATTAEGGYITAAAGGFTGEGEKYEPAGVVHKGEYVIPQEGVDQETKLPDPEYIKKLLTGGIARTKAKRVTSNLAAGIKSAALGGVVSNDSSEQDLILDPGHADRYANVEELGDVTSKKDSGEKYNGKSVHDLSFDFDKIKKNTELVNKHNESYMNAVVNDDVSRPEAPADVAPTAKSKSGDTNWKTKKIGYEWTPEDLNNDDGHTSKAELEKAVPAAQERKDDSAEEFYTEPEASIDDYQAMSIGSGELEDELKPQAGGGGGDNILPPALPDNTAFEGPFDPPQWALEPAAGRELATQNRALTDENTHRADDAEWEYANVEPTPTEALPPPTTAKALPSPTTAPTTTAPTPTAAPSRAPRDFSFLRRLAGFSPRVAQGLVHGAADVAQGFGVVGGGLARVAGNLPGLLNISGNSNMNNMFGPSNAAAARGIGDAIGGMSEATGKIVADIAEDVGLPIPEVLEDMVSDDQFNKQRNELMTKLIEHVDDLKAHGVPVDTPRVFDELKNIANSMGLEAAARAREANIKARSQHKRRYA